MERRLPIIVVVRLAQAECADTGGEERTYTDNISAHGARVFSRNPWQLGEKVRVTPVNEESTACGNVVHCHQLADDRYWIGVQFQDRPVMWSSLRRYDGLYQPPAKSGSS
jgi:PilZ domain